MHQHNNGQKYKHIIIEVKGGGEMNQEWDEIEKVIHTYYNNRYEMLGEKKYEDFKWAYLFLPTLQGRRTYFKERRLLEEEIDHACHQPIDLGFTTFNIAINWCSRQLQRNLCKVTMQLKVEIFYNGNQGIKTIEQSYHCMRLMKGLGKWCIETDRYFNEFEDWNFGNKKRKIIKEKVSTTKMPKGIYKREKAVAYAKKYAVTPNAYKWKNYTKWGGDCTNFISQCLYAGEIPFDHAGKSVLEKWYWYSDAYRTPSWTSADAFKTYMLNNKGYGLVAQLSDFQHMEIGDVVQLGTLEKTTHSMLVVDVIYKDEKKEEIVDLLVAQHSDEGGIFGYNIPLSTKPPARLYYKILGYNPQYT